MDERKGDKKAGAMMIAAAAILGVGLAVVFGFLARDCLLVYRDDGWRFLLPAGYYVLMAVPCVLALSAFVKLIGLIQSDRSFSRESEGAMRFIGWMAFAEAGIFLIGAAVTWDAMGGLMAVLLFLTAIAVVVGLLACALTRLIHRACLLREENDLTV